MTTTSYTQKRMNFWSIIKIARYCFDSVVRGYHVYKEVWEASRGEMLSCARETGNALDPFTVYVGTGFNCALSLTWMYSSRVD